MATISSGSGSARGQKALTSDIPLVPFLDLLLCCVMFLLVTAMWNQLARIDASKRGPCVGMDTPEDPALRLTLAVLTSGYELSRTTEERRSIAGHDVNALRTMLEDWRTLDEHGSDMTVASEDGVRYEAIITAMDIAAGAGFTRLDLADRLP